MIRSTRFALTLFAGVAAAMAAMAAPSAARVLDCSEYLSTALIDDPGTGVLVGTETRTETYTFIILTAPGNIGSSTTVTRTVTYEVGYYDMGDDEDLVAIDCRTYTLAS